MAETFASRQVIQDLYDESIKTLSREDAVLDVAGRTAQDPVVIESVVWARESAHSAAEVLG